MQKKKSLEILIWEAFQRPEPPELPSVLLNHKDSEMFEETQIFWGKDWAQLTVEIFEDTIAFAFFTPVEGVYYFGCLSWLVCKEEAYAKCNDTLMSIIRRTVYKKKTLKAPLEKFADEMTSSQKKATAQFLLTLEQKVSDFDKRSIQELLESGVFR